MKRIVLVLSLIFIFCGCQNSYKIENNSVYFEDKEIKNADPKTFEVLLSSDFGRYYAKDKNNVYCYDDKFDEVDYSTFQVLNSMYAKDKNKVFVDCVEIKENVDIESFVVIDDFDWAKDKNSVYFDGIKLENSDPNTFIILDDNFAKDKNNVYYHWIGEYAIKLENADSNTFKIINSEGYAKDKNNCYFLEIVKPMSECDKIENQK